MVGSEETNDLQRQGAPFEYVLDCSHVGFSARVYIDYVCDLVEVEGRVLSFQVHDEPTDPGRKDLALGLLRSEQTRDSVTVEALYPAIQCPL